VAMLPAITKAEAIQKREDMARLILFPFAQNPVPWPAVPFAPKRTCFPGIASKTVR